MADVYTEEQLHQMSSDELVPLFLSLQEKQGEVERTLQIVLEQLADLKRHRFGRSTERLDDIPGQLSIFDHEAGEFFFDLQAIDINGTISENVIQTIYNEAGEAEKPVTSYFKLNYNWEGIADAPYRDQDGNAVYYYIVSAE